MRLTTTRLAAPKAKTQHSLESLIITLPSPFGALVMILSHDAKALLSLKFGKESALHSTHNTALAEPFIKQCQRYFADATAPITCPLKPQGTPFQHRVWAHLRTIAPGRVQTYGEIAKCLSTSARAVGNACRDNPIAILIPCHRVLSQSGLGGYGGKTRGSNMQRKRALLHHEGYSSALLSM